MNDVRIPLAHVLGALNAEILKADEAARAPDQTPVMAFQSCELEFAVDFETTAEGGIKFWVLKLGAGAKKTDSNTITVRYTALESPPPPGAKVAPALGSTGAVEAYKRTGKLVGSAEPKSPPSVTE